MRARQQKHPKGVIEKKKGKEPVGGKQLKWIDCYWRTTRLGHGEIFFSRTCQGLRVSQQTSSCTDRLSMVCPIVWVTGLNCMLHSALLCSDTGQ